MHILREELRSGAHVHVRCAALRCSLFITNYTIENVSDNVWRNK